ncbi:MAG: hypothetical protein IH598_15080 [Bacteroidales bacterium]|nr:hypothetical protein [Bacteroidales bacterium]
MKDKVATTLRIFLTLLLVVSGVLFIIFYSTGEEFTSAVLTWGYILLAITVIVTIVFPILNTISNPKSGKTVLVGIIGFIVLYLISHGLASGNIEGDVYQVFNITEATSRFIGAMLNMTFILAIVAVLAIIYSGISNSLK